MRDSDIDPERSGKRTGKRPGDGAFLTGERLVLSQPTEGASAALKCSANLSGKADSGGPEQPKIELFTVLGACHVR
jgi:hypothetical protein